MAKDTCSGGEVEAFCERGQHLGHTLGGSFEAVEWRGATSAEAGATGLAAQALDALRFAVGAVADQGVELRVSNLEVGAGGIGASKAIGRDMFGLATTALHTGTEQATIWPQIENDCMVHDSCLQQQPAAAVDSGLDSRERDPRIPISPTDQPRLAAFAAAFPGVATVVLIEALRQRPAATLASTQALVEQVEQRSNPPRDAAVLVFDCWQRGERLREESARRPRSGFVDWGAVAANTPGCFLGDDMTGLDGVQL